MDKQTVAASSVRQPDFVLASQSKRRIELLTRLGFDFRVIPSDAPEDVGFDLLPEELVMGLASRKANSVAEICGDDPIVIAADTVVFDGSHILGKPRDSADACEMLGMLSGRTHVVYTGIAVTSRHHIETDFVKTDVTFAELNDSMIKAYVATGEPLDKAGAYGIQELGAILVNDISGDYFNVMGLPLRRLTEILESGFGITPYSWLRKGNR